MNEKPKRKQSSSGEKSPISCGIFVALATPLFIICLIGAFVYIQQDLMQSPGLITTIELDGEDARVRIIDYVGTALPESATDFHWYSQDGFTSDYVIEFSFKLSPTDVEAWLENLDFCFDISWNGDDNYRASCGDNPLYFIDLASQENEQWLVTIRVSKW